MRKTLLALALALTASNLALGVYASVCETAGGARMCGTACMTGSDGGCLCQGECTAAELKWVDGASGGGGGDEELMSE